MFPGNVDFIGVNAGEKVDDILFDRNPTSMVEVMHDMTEIGINGQLRQAGLFSYLTACGFRVRFTRIELPLREPPRLSGRWLQQEIQPRSITDISIDDRSRRFFRDHSSVTLLRFHTHHHSNTRHAACQYSGPNRSPSSSKGCFLPQL